MPKLIRLYIQSTLIGFALAALFTALLLWFNIANLGHLVVHANGGWLAAFLLVFFNGIVFGGVQFGIRIMALGHASDRREDDDDGPGGTLIPIPIRSRDRR